MLYYTYKTTVNPKTQSNQPTFEELMSGHWEVPTTTDNSYIRQSTMLLNNMSLEFRAKTLVRVNACVHKIRRILDAWHDETMSEHYRHFEIPKASGGMRPIDAPEENLKNDLRFITSELQYYCSPEHAAAYAYVPHKNHAASLQHHQKREHYWYLKMDLHNFFGSCTQEVTDRELQKIPFFKIMHDYQLRAYEDLLHISMLDGKLPQGSPLSPWLTNQIMVSFDYGVQNICKTCNVCYTRYADDMLFSANNRMEEIPSIVRAHLPEGFTINAEKTHRSSIAGQNWNLGLMINRENQITVGNKQKEIFRARLTEFCHNHTHYSKEHAQQLYGSIAYYKQIEPEYFNNLLTKYGLKFNIDIETRLKSLCN